MCHSVFEKLVKVIKALPARAAHRLAVLLKVVSIIFSLRSCHKIAWLTTFAIFHIFLLLFALSFGIVFIFYFSSTAVIHSLVILFIVIRVIFEKILRLNKLPLVIITVILRLILLELLQHS